MKLVSIIGILLKTDRATAMKDLLSYVCVFVEMFIDDELSEVVSFENEWGIINYIMIKY